MISTLATRRYGIYLVILALCVLFLGRYHDGVISVVKYNYSPYAPRPANGTDSLFHWKDVPVHFPVRSLTSLPTGTPRNLPDVQFKFLQETSAQAETRKKRQAAVKATFQRCWASYKEYAWMMDELGPMTGRYKSGFGGWAASLVDSLDTLWIMGMTKEFHEAAGAAVDIDLGTATTETINVFETTIRHLGGFLSAYDLSGEQALLDKATEFAEMLLHAFDTPNRMPITRWKPQEALAQAQEADEVVLVAEIGSLTMEFTHLSQLTGDMRYYDAVNRIMKVFAEQQESTQLPGMWPVVVNARTLDFTQDTSFTLSAMSDSLYEYLPKMHALLGGNEPLYSKLYTRSMETAIKHNIWKPMTPDDADILMSGNVRTLKGQEPDLQPQGQHLVCFAGGMFALGGRLTGEEAHVKLGQKLTDGCIWTYRHTPLGIMPEVFNMAPCASRVGPCAWDEARYRKVVQEYKSEGEGDDADELIQARRLPKGFTDISDRRYILRPEAIESVFVLYRITGEPYLLEAAWEMFQAIANATETPVANAALMDVTFTTDELEANAMDVRMDSMESFWLAETLKYFYLIFSEPSLMSLDEWVFNTEAHPFKRALP